MFYSAVVIVFHEYVLSFNRIYNNHAWAIFHLLGFVYQALYLYVVTVNRLRVPPERFPFAGGSMRDISGFPVA